MLRVEPGLVVRDHPVGGRVDHGHRGTAAVGHVDAVGHPPHRRAEHVRPGVGVDVRRVCHRRHPRQRHRQVRHRACDRPGRCRMRCRACLRGGAGVRGGRRRRVRRPSRRGIVGVRCCPEDHRNDRGRECDGQGQAPEPGPAPGLSIRRPAGVTHTAPPCGVIPLLTQNATRLRRSIGGPFRAAAARPPDVWRRHPCPAIERI